MLQTPPDNKNYEGSRHRLVINIPNSITFLRLPLFVWFVWEAARGNIHFAFALFLGVWALDGVDGVIARLLNQATSFGYYFDKVVDRVVMVGGVVVLVRYGIVPPTALLLMVRDIGYIPAVYPFHKKEKNWHTGGRLAQAATLLQGLGFLWLYMEWPYPAMIIAAAAAIGGLAAFNHLRQLLAVVVIALGISAMPAAARAQVIISEIMWDGVEYVELHNNTTDEIALENWKLTRQQQDGEEKTIYVFSEESPVGDGEFFLIEKNEEATTVPADIVASSLTLVNTGEIVRLYDNDGNVVDSAGDFAGWPAGKNTETGISMERVGSAWQDSGGSGGGRSGTPRAPNSSGPVPANSPPTSQDNDQQYTTDIIINEFLPNPIGADTTGEFIELYNPSNTSADISGWQLDDASGGSAPYTVPDGAAVGPKQYAVFWSEQTKIALNNTGDEVRLLDPIGNVQASTSYSETVSEGQSYNWDKGGYVKSTTATPGATNTITAPAESNEATSKATKPKATATPTPAKTAGKQVAGSVRAAAASVVIYRFLPDPVGSDDAEYIELKNIGTSPANILGYQLDDEDGGSRPYTIPDNTSIPAGETAVFSREDTGIALNNNGDTVRLLDPDGVVVDSYSYGKVAEGEIVEAAEANAVGNNADDEGGKTGTVAGIQKEGEDNSAEGGDAAAEDIQEHPDALPHALAQLTGGEALSGGEASNAGQDQKSKAGGVAVGVTLLAGAGIAAATSFGDKEALLKAVGKVIGWRK